MRLPKHPGYYWYEYGDNRVAVVLVAQFSSLKKRPKLKYLSPLTGNWYPVRDTHGLHWSNYPVPETMYECISYKDTPECELTID